MSLVNIPDIGASNFKESSPSFATLPATGNEIGDVRSVTDTGLVYSWTGTVWSPIGSGASGDVVGPVSATDNALTRFDSTTGKILQNSGVIVSDTNDITGVNSLNTITSTEISYLSGVTSTIQTQLNGKEPSISTLPISKGGTNSSAALNNNRVIISSSSAIVEHSAITVNRALASNASGLPIASSVTDTELGYLSGVTSAIQGQIDSKLSLSGGTLTGTLLLASGTAASPSAAFSASTGTGFFRSGTDILGISTAGTQRGSINASGKWIIGTSGAGITHDVIGGIQFLNTNLSDGVDLYRDGAEGAMRIQGDDGGTPSAVEVHGSAHATRPYVVRLMTQGVERISINSSGTTSISGAIVSTNNLAIGTETSGDANTTVSSTVSYHGVTTLTAPRTKTLPAASSMADGSILMIKDESGNASTHNITISRAGADTIDGLTSVTISASYGVARLIKRGTGNWFTL